MQEVHLDELITRVHRPTRAPHGADADSTTSARDVAGHVQRAWEEELSGALTRCGIPQEEELLLRELQLPLRHTAGVGARAQDWAEVAALAIQKTLASGGEGVARYPYPRAALVDFACSLARQDLRREWAWKQLGLLAPRRRADGETLTLALEHQPEAVLPTLCQVAEYGALADLARRMDPTLWRRLAHAALAAMGQGLELLQLDPMACDEPLAQGSESLPANAELHRSRLLRAVEQQPSRFLTDPHQLQVWACLACLEIDPGRVLEPAEPLWRATVAALARARRAGEEPNAEAESLANRSEPEQRWSSASSVDLGGQGELQGAHEHSESRLGDGSDSSKDERHSTAIAHREQDESNGDDGRPFRTLDEGQSGNARRAQSQAAEDSALLSSEGSSAEGGDQGQARGATGLQSVREHQDAELRSTSGAEQPTPPSGATQLATTPAAATDTEQATAALPPLLGIHGRRSGRTEFGGLLFLLPLLPELWPSSVDQHLDAGLLGRQRGLRWCLHRLALGLLPLSPEDPAALAFAGLRPGDAAPEPEKAVNLAEEVLVQAWVSGLRMLLLRRLGMSTAAAPTAGGEIDPQKVVLRCCRQPALIVADPGWIEVHMSLERVDLTWRRAGLDLDPGWVPWLGSVLRFVYRDQLGDWPTVRSEAGPAAAEGDHGR